MIAVHRISQPDREVYVNPDLIQVVEGNPDTVIVLCNGTKFLVSETPAEVAELVCEWRASILTAIERPSPETGRRATFGRLAAVVELPRDDGHAD